MLFVFLPFYDTISTYTILGYCRVANRAELSPSDIVGLRIVLEPEKHYRYDYTQAHWDAATASWGHQGRGHAPADQSCIQVEIKK